MKARPLPPIELLRSLFEYNPETGDITWKQDRSRLAKAGTVAGWEVPVGYLSVQLRLDGKRTNFRAHRLAWALHYGEDPHPFELDHIDRNKLNNRIDNLRKVTHSENMRNRNRYRTRGGCLQ